MYDIALPDDNEDILVEEYLKNNIKNIVFCYEINDKNDLNIFKIDKIKYFEKINIYYCALINNEDIKKTLELLYDLFYSERLYNDLIFIQSKDLKYNSEILNRYQFNGIINPIKYDKKYYFNGISKEDINKIIKNNISITYNIKDIIKNIQNFYSIQFFNRKFVKRGIKALVGSFASKKIEIPNKYQIISFHKILRLNNTFDNLIFQINRTRNAKRKDYFTKGFYIAKYPLEDCYF